MQKKMLVIAIAAALTAGVASFVLARTVLPAPPAGSPVPRTITYEGNLDQNGKPAPDGTYDFAFTFWNDVAAGTQVGTKISKTGVQVTGGKFTVEIGPIDEDAVFETNPLYVELSVDNNKLAPRQKINAGVFAVRAERAETAVDGVPVGSIVMWSGSIGATPSGWAVCDGTKGTPDLRERFIMGSGAVYATGNTGGATNRVLTTNELPYHSHAIVDDAGRIPYFNENYAFYYNEPNGARGGWDDACSPAPGVCKKAMSRTQSAGNGAAFEILPPFYVLAFIMKCAASGCQ